MTAAAEAARPFFIVGAQRSGTTMLRLMLNNHPALAVPFESVFIPEFYRRLGEYGDLREHGNVERLLGDICADRWVQRGGLVPDPGAVLARGVDSYPALVDAIFSEYARSRGKRRWGDKTPTYVTELDVLWELFPGCRFVHLVRDGRDVALSLSGISWGSSHIPRIAEEWRWKTTLAHKMGRMIPDHYLEVRYEDLVREPTAALRAICGFLGEPYSDAMLDYHASGEQEMPQDSLQWHRSSVSAPDPSKLDAWKRRMSVPDQILFEEFAGSALDLFGYERLNRPATLGSRLRRMRYTLVKRW